MYLFAYRRGEEFQLCSDILSVGKYVVDISKLQKSVNELRERTILINEVINIFYCSLNMTWLNMNGILALREIFNFGILQLVVVVS